mmetsp:Transcript_88275/g.140372  ORF Transcript_88275/g.140372 Transcript_88275/m.140372 type:complete len:364 (+) Transcript_88275:398-1489(+)
MSIQAWSWRNGPFLGAADAGPAVHQEFLFKLALQLRRILLLRWLFGLRSDHVKRFRMIGGGFGGGSHGAVDMLMDGTSRRIAHIFLMIQHEGGLGHRKDDQIRPRVDGPGGSCQTSPAKLAGNRSSILFLMLRLNLPKPIVAHARLVEDEGRLLSVASHGNMIADHTLNRLSFQDPHPVQFSKVADHDQEANVVIEGADHATPHLQGDVHSATCGQNFGHVLSDPTAFFSPRVDNFQSMRQLWLPFDLNAPIPRPNPACVLLWHLEARVPHLQRSTDSLFHDDVQRLARNDLQDASNHIQAIAVVPEASRLPFQWHTGQLIAPRLQAVDLAIFGLFGQLLKDLVVGTFLRRPGIIQGGSVTNT